MGHLVVRGDAIVRGENGENDCSRACVQRGTSHAEEAFHQADVAHVSRVTECYEKLSTNDEMKSLWMRRTGAGRPPGSKARKKDEKRAREDACNGGSQSHNGDVQEVGLAMRALVEYRTTLLAHAGWTPATNGD